MSDVAVATDPVSPTPKPAKRGRARRWLVRIASVLVALVIGLVIAEFAFRARDDGAFPHLNTYVADPVLGVRLMPGATERIAFGGNPATDVRINSSGFRGTDLPAPGADEVLVVGDSQVFGLGVQEDQTFSSKLGVALRRNVVNGGVPTYGPFEYKAVIAEQLAARHPKTVVLTINLVNDLFEVNHLNKDRHAVWDGWAVRKDTAPPSTTWFPGRDFVYRRSHLFFALRKWWHSDDKLADAGFASEGTWKDAIDSGAQLKTARAAADKAKQERATQIGELQQKLRTDDETINQAIQTMLERSSTGFDGSGEYLQKQIAIASPGDIVSDGFGEGARSVVATADQIRAAAAVRAKLRAEVVEWAKKNREKEYQEQATAVLASTEDQKQSAARLAEIDAQRAAVVAALKPPLGDYFADVKQLCEKNGARLVILILPIDTQVSAEEWKKYGVAPMDMEPSKALTAELVAYGESLGITTLDSTPVLAAAEPGAFLNHDIHMTPKGHAAVATALAEAIAQPAPIPPKVSERSPVPVPPIWKTAPEVIVTGSSAANCETKQVREWVRILCTLSAKAYPTSIAVEHDDAGEALTLMMPKEAALLVPLVEGREFSAKIEWTDATRVLHIAWPKGGKPAMAFDKPVPKKHEKIDDEFDSPVLYDRVKYLSPVERAICDCWNTVYGGARYKNSGEDEYYECHNAYGATDAACVGTYYGTKDQCGNLISCIWRDPTTPPDSKKAAAYEAAMKDAAAAADAALKKKHK